VNQQPGIYDLAVIGGGINGVGIAADAASRGLKVALIEKGDLAAATSSSSSKLIHGGLRYLETREFKLVRKALKESELLVNLAPHLVKPFPIYIPYQPHHRPWWMIRAGLFFYNHLASRPHYQSASGIRFTEDSPLVSDLSTGFRYSDAQVDDARLVVMNARQAARYGAEIFTYRQCVGLGEDNGTWRVESRGSGDGSTSVLHARVVVNATGPWVSNLIAESTPATPRHQVRLVKGGHLVIPRLYPQKQGYLLQNDDGRVVFVLPFLEDFTLIGTTEVEIDSPTDSPEVSEPETCYLIDVVNKYFRCQTSVDQVVYSYSGIRPLMDSREGSATRASRDFKLEFEDTNLPLLSVYGGKVTTYRLLALQAVERLRSWFPHMPISRSDSVVLPGGELESLEKLGRELTQVAPWLDAFTRQRWINNYGSLALELATYGNAATGAHDFGFGLTQKEVDYLVEQEWAVTAADILWRRTKLGLYFNSVQTAALSAHLAAVSLK